MEPLNEQSIGCEDNDSWTKSLVCDSCGKRDGPSKPWVCRDCLEEINPKIEELQVKKEFLILPNEPDELFADFKLIVKDEDGSEGPPIACHKKIPVDRSPVFDAMLRYSSESKTGTVIIEEVSYEAVKLFVQYLYKGKESLADQLDHELARKLFLLADRYQVMHLKDYFEEFIVSNLTWHNSALQMHIAAYKVLFRGFA
ncbi:BTB/POZ domain-containing protein At4g08455-like [Eucalyptus grandis]|uniref:BTB/POZ domain-containing protein At4g08455-like n=1 Tax=Eucalyptus grandis TaxID=71139 RepID=UPI00192E9058|nr:BTB/POZ domain-containing protein At4g08455-like [Eucalyptus grandis]